MLNEDSFAYALGFNLNTVFTPLAPGKNSFK